MLQETQLHLTTPLKQKPAASPGSRPVSSATGCLSPVQQELGAGMKTIIKSSASAAEPWQSSGLVTATAWHWTLQGWPSARDSAGGKEQLCTAAGWISLRLHTGVQHSCSHNTCCTALLSGAYKKVKLKAA